MEARLVFLIQCVFVKLFLQHFKAFKYYTLRKYFLTEKMDQANAFQNKISVDLKKKCFPWNIFSLAKNVLPCSENHKY